MLGLKGAFHRQCLSCHQDWSHENACNFCHMPAAGFGKTPPMAIGYHGEAERKQAQDTYVYETRHEPLPVATFHHSDHATKFGLSCVDCHHGASCTDCHDLGVKQKFDHTRTAGWPLEPNHADIGCTSCHDPEHRFDAPTSARCTACPRVGRNGAFDHAELGVPLLGDHAEIDCAMCHRGRLHVGATADCAACHADKHFPDDLSGRVQGVSAP